MLNHVNDENYMVDRAIITPKNVDVDNINQMLILKFPGEEKEYTSWDSVEDDNHNLFQEEFLNSLNPSGPHKGTRFFLHRMPLKSEDNSGLPFELTRRQFPIRLSFALIINKAQGQTIPNIGIFLRNHVFSHGQLYVALSRGVSQDSTKILVKDWNLERQSGVFTRNVVFKEVLLPNRE
ncbi:uncharacterized protein [Primulina eburnea]|uniref:uncharacterized protein n=1 Tax=Primulina eburnea TaxID=1245227 RepID=UPI003C6C0036